MKPWITFQEKIEYQFKIPRILEEALTHKSFAHESRTENELFPHNERLEFIGDAVLDLAIARLLMELDFFSTEGELSKRRASLVNEENLAQMARELELPDYIILGKGELASQGNQKDSILSSALEAIIGGIFLDGGFDAAMKLIEKLFQRPMSEMRESKISFVKDYKTRLQEEVQGKFRVTPKYKVLRTEGPEHAKIFHVVVSLGEEVLGEGSGRSRKEAEQKAAQMALEKQGVENV